jgi:CHAT domain-containing protein
VGAGNPTFEEWMKQNKWDRLEEAIPSLLIQKEKKEKENPFKEDDYYNIVMSLHYCYMQIGDIASTQKLLSSAMAVYNQRSSEPNSEYTRGLWLCMGDLEFTLKNFGQALAYFNQAQCMYEESNDFGEAYIGMLMNLALSYQANGDILSAKIYIDEAKEQFEHLYGSIFSISNEEHFKVLLSYGNVCEVVGHSNEAEKCFKYIVNHCKKTALSQETYILAYNNLAALYMKQGRWSEGANLLEGLEGGNNERNYLVAQNMALCQLYLRNYPKSISSLREMNSSSLYSIDAIFSNFTGLEHENYWRIVSRELIFVNNLIAYQTNASDAISMAYNNTIFCKTLLANSSTILDRFAMQSSNSDIRVLYSRYKELKNSLAFKTNSKSVRDSLILDITDIERTLLSSMGNLGKQLLDMARTWQDVKAFLDDDEIAIEYCYAPRMEHYPDVQPYYGAFVIRKDFDHPVLVSLENVDSMEAVFDNIESDALLINELYASNKSVSLHNMLWSKIIPYMNGVKKVYYSPTGYLSNINFEVLRNEAGVMLNERYTMCRVSSTANISDVKASEGMSYQSSALYGNIMYDESMDAMAEASSAYDEYSGTEIVSELALRSENERGKWGAIPSTKKEIENIYRLLKGKGVLVSVFDSIAANEESFKSLHRRSPDILHLATHGFVIDTPQKAKGNKFVPTTNIYSQKDSYLMWAGLMLAGGNNIWQGRFNLTNVEDGILTADEISRLDLSNTKLVVLSACETARGKVDPVDGVYGLQRAFKLAGVQTIVMSLWKVQDDATAMLMTQFYTYLTSGVEKHQALWSAMMDVRRKYKDPYYWAGFVMLD